MEKLPAESHKNISEEELLELAKKELLRDVKCASVRAEQFGAHSWAKPQKYVPNKRFLRHMLVNASRDNYRTDEKLKHNRSARITSTSSHHSHKHEHSLQNDKVKRPKFDDTMKEVAPKKRSRWDSSPESNKLELSHKSKNKAKKSDHQSTKVKKRGS